MDHMPSILVRPAAIRSPIIIGASITHRKIQRAQIRPQMIFLRRSGPTIFSSNMMGFMSSERRPSGSGSVGEMLGSALASPTLFLRALHALE